MQFDKLTIKSQEALQDAQSQSGTRGHQSVEATHLLVALLSQSEGSTVPVLQKIGVSIDALGNELERTLEQQPKVSGGAQAQISPELNRILEGAFKEATSMTDEYVSTEHLLLAMAKDESNHAGRILRAAGANADGILQALTSIRGSSRITDQDPESKYQALEKFGSDLTDEARAGKLDPVIGRDEEIRRVIQVLSRRSKNNPVLIGEPGVGKTAIAEGLAQRVVAGDVPETLKNRRVISLDIGSLVAGAKYRGEFEDRLKAVLREVSEANGQVILFNRAAEQLLGLEARDVVGKMNVKDIYLEAQAMEVMRRLRSEAFGGRGRLESSRNELLARGGLYSRLVRGQLPFESRSRFDQEIPRYEY